MEETDHLGNWTKDDIIDAINYVGKFPNQDTYEHKVQRLAKKYPSVAEAKAHLDALMALVEHGE